MPTPIVFTLTNGGALDANTNGVSLTEIAIGSGKYTPLATRTALDTELARYPLSGGDVEPNSKTLRFSAVLESATTQQAFEVGLFTSTGELFAVASTTGADPLILVTANIAFVGSFGLSVSEISAGSVTVVTDSSAPIAVAMMAQHVADADPHPQYAMKEAFDDHVTEYDEHVVQNTSEHNLLLTAINQAFDQLNNFRAKVGDIRATATAMTAAAFTSAQNDGSAWEVYGAGRTIVGAGSVTIDYSAAAGDAARSNKTQSFTAGSTGGEIDHKQTTAEMRNHSHSDGIYNKFTALALNALNAGDVSDQNGDGINPTTVGADNTNPEMELQISDISAAQLLAMAEKPRGGNEPFNVMQPYIVACQFVCVTAATPIPALVFPS